MKLAKSTDVNVGFIIEFETEEMARMLGGMYDLSFNVSYGDGQRYGQEVY